MSSLLQDRLQRQITSEHMPGRRPLLQPDRSNRKYGDSMLCGAPSRPDSRTEPHPDIQPIMKPNLRNRFVPILSLLLLVLFGGACSETPDNIAETRRVVEYAGKFGVCVEAELGHVPDAIPGTGESAMNPSKISDTKDTLTRVSDVERFVEETGVDALAVAIGTAHGTYISAPKLDIARLSQINAVSKAALVLHGGSGTPEDELKAAIAAGISKINVYTDLVTAYNVRMRENYMGMTNMGTWPVINSSKPIEAMCEKAAAYIKLFGSAGRA